MLDLNANLTQTIKVVEAIQKCVIKRKRVAHASHDKTGNRQNENISCMVVRKKESSYLVCMRFAFECGTVFRS